MRRNVLALWAALAARALCAELPAGWTLKGEGEAATISAPVQGGQSVELALTLGRLDQPLVVRAADADKGVVELVLAAKDLPQSPWPWKKEIARDAGIEVSLRRLGQPWLFRGTHWVRPNPHFYHGADLKKALDGWDKLPAATAHRVELRLEFELGAVAFWLDDRYLGRAELAAATLTLALKAGHSLLAASVGKCADHGRYVPIRLGGYRRAGEAGAAKANLAPGPQTLGGVPFHVAAPDESIDVGLSRWLMESVGPDEFTDDYYTRSAHDGTPESIILAVPTDEYAWAHLLCAVDPDPAKTPVLTLRLTRFLGDSFDSGGRGDAIADTTVRVEPAAPGALRQIRVPLRSGQIADVLDEKGVVCGRSTQSLDLELTKELGRVAKLNHANYSTKPLGRPSAVRVFALTLERSPIRVRLAPKQVGNIFYATERPELVLNVANVSEAGFRGEVVCDIADFYGAKRTLSQEVAVEAGKTQIVRLDVGGPRLGWSQADIRLARDGDPVWDTTTSFAVLPPDTRKAGVVGGTSPSRVPRRGDTPPTQESPFGTWWFRDSHIGTKDVAEVAPLLQRLGFRHVCPGGSGPSGEELAKHGLSVSMLPNLMRAKAADTEKAIDAAVKAHPEAKWALIFHESGFGEPIVFPPEFIGQPVPKLSEKQEAQFQKLWDQAIEVSKLYRAKHPQIKLIFGNSSLPFAVEFMRRGYPRELVDAFGDEDLGQLIMPEYPPQAFKSLYFQREYQKLYKYDVPVTTTYEWRGRPTTPGCLTEREQAELYARDCLQCLAYGAPHINVALLHDVGDSYYYSRWGGTGLLHRWPLLHPKPSYVALATLTRELDGAKFTRYLPSNSPSLYLCEFQRGAEWVYALWTPRGEREVTLGFEGDARYTASDSMGNALDGKLRVSSLPIYLRAASRITQAVGGPTACEAPPAKRTVVDDLCDAGKWAAVAERDAALEKGHFDFPRRQGKFDIAARDDAEKGRALEVKLLPQPDVPPLCPRYLVLKPKDPIPVPGEPQALGVWVKGNSSWGRVMWEIEDAKGERFFSISASEEGWMVGDWKARSYINFDGWNYLQVKLLTWYASGFYGPERCDWHFTAEGRVDFPVRVTRLVLELRDRVVHLTDLVPVPEPAVRLRDLGASYE
ncbi:MAG TPA: hypothetical protein P5532_16020 [Planctomycetota bacterium]|nr:hypothetical protein [Planctomycetota bacterium]